MTPQSDAEVMLEQATAQAQFDRVAAAVFATVLVAIFAVVLWWIDQLNFVTGFAEALWWMQTYRSCGGDPLNYPGSIEGDTEMTLENDTTAIDELLPDWAISRANGNYLAIGACLPTRDGRRIGDATVIGVGDPVGAVDMVATIITDTGNRVKLNLKSCWNGFISESGLRVIRSD